jgi:hypothetical protein
MRKRSATGPPFSWTTHSARKDQAAEPWGQVMNKWTPSPSSPRQQWQQWQHGDRAHQRLVVAFLQREDVVEEREHNVGGGSREGGAGQPSQGSMPGKVWLAVLQPGGGGTKGEFSINLRSAER